jgi:hypothetical protein
LIIVCGSIPVCCELTPIHLLSVDVFTKCTISTITGLCKWFEARLVPSCERMQREMQECPDTQFIVPDQKIFTTYRVFFLINRFPFVIRIKLLRKLYQNYYKLSWPRGENR